MRYHRPAIIALAVLLVALQSGGPAAVGQEAPQEPARVSPKGDTAVPDDALYTPFDQVADDAIEAFAIANKGLPPDDREPGSQLARTRNVAFPISAGTGGGDIAELEPNDSPAFANFARDLPFQCMGEISHNTDVDLIRIDVTAGVPIEVDVFADIAFISSPLDPVIYVVAADSVTLIAYDDDVSYPTNLNSRVFFTPDYTGPVYLYVRSAVQSGGEGYDYIVAAWPTLSPVFSSIELEPNDSPWNADLMVVPGAKTGAIGEPGDVDMTWFEAPAGATIVVDLHSRSYGMPLDSIVEIIDATGRIVFANDDADSTRDSRFNLVTPYTGYYLVRVRDYNGYGGPQYGYILSVSLQDRANSPVVSKLKLVRGNELKKVTGLNFTTSTLVEVGGAVIPSVPSAVSPMTIIKVKPRFPVLPDHWVTTLNPDGRRSNPVNPIPGA